MKAGGDPGAREDGASERGRLHAWVLRAARAFMRVTPASMLGALTILVLPLVVNWPWLADASTYGFHDWDVETSHRYLVKKTLLEYHQFPGWNPYACGGFPAWGYVESGTIVVSPWLPFYLFGDMRVALRIEVLGMTILGALGSYLLAGRFTKSHAARALVVALFAVNGRWGLQAAAGHTWHLAYALTPWCWYFFERARERRRRLGDLVLLALSFSGLVYTGAIYPLPHTVLLVGLWALGVAVIERSVRPLTTLALGGVGAVGFAAPKLLPLLATFERAPRVIDSTERLDLGAFVTLLTSRDQAFYSRPASVSPYGWHEWGMYISASGAAILALAFVFTNGRREAWLKAIGAVFVVLGFGAFHAFAPWTLLHAHAPVFRSQHVPSRFLYPAVLVLALVAASGIGRAIERASALRPWLDAAAAAAVFVIGFDVARVAQKPMKDAMWMVPPDSIPTKDPFRWVENPIYQYKRRDWAAPMYLSMIGNTGVLNCYGAPPFDGKGALSWRDPRYRGEAFVEGGGHAQVIRWTPNEFEIEAEAPQASVVVYNMNFDPGFSVRVSGEGGNTSGPALRDQDRLAALVPAGRSRVVFSYMPPHLGLGLALAALTASLFSGAYLLGRRRARA